MNLKQLEYFVAIADEHQITAAAKKLHISQPPLSYELAQLEHELGTTLVRRGPRTATLTDAGKLLYQRATRILALAKATERDVANVGKGMSGTVSLGLASSCSGSVPAERLGELAESFPDIAVELHEGSTDQVLELLEAGEVDVGVVRTPFKSQGLRCRYATKSEHMLAVMPPLFETGTDMEVTIAQLGDKPLIGCRRLESVIRPAFDEEGIAPYVSCLTEDERTACAWARGGLGIALVPETLLPVTDTGECFIKIVRSEALSTRQAVVWKADRYMSPLAERLIKLIGEVS